MKHATVEICFGMGRKLHQGENANNQQGENDGY